MPLTKDEGFWSGATWIGQGTIVNNGAISDVSIIITLPVGSEMLLDWGRISHNDATASTVQAIIRDPSDNTLTILASVAAVTQNSVIQVPGVGTVPGTSGNFPQYTLPVFISGGMDLIMSALTIDDTEGITWSCQGRLGNSSRTPVLTTVGGGAETVTTNTDVVV